MSRSFRFLSALLLSGLFLVPAPAQTVTGPELVFQTGVVAANGLPNFPDGNLAWRWPPTVGRPHPILFGSASGQQGTLDIPTRAQRSPRAKGLPSGYTYAAGAGAIITNPLNSHWLCITHLERKPNDPGGFYGSLGVLWSSDKGQTWNWLGEIITPNYQFRNPMPMNVEVGGGSTVWNGEYLYCYFWDTAQSTAGCSTFAYCKAYDLFRAEKQGQVNQWTKWDGGSIPNATGPPGLGGLGAQLPGIVPSPWNSVVYFADKGYYFQCTCPWASKQLFLYRSSDGISWSALSGGNTITAGEPGFKYYPSMIGLNPDERFVEFDQAGYLWVYYLVTPTDPFTWKDARVYRRKVFPRTANRKRRAA